MSAALASARLRVSSIDLPGWEDALFPACALAEPEGPSGAFLDEFDDGPEADCMAGKVSGFHGAYHVMSYAFHQGRMQ